MKYYLIAPAVLVRADQSAFTYHAEAALRVGQIVRVSIGKRQANGVVLQLVSKPSFQTKPISAVLDAIIPPPLLATATWIASYYATHLAFVLQVILPAGLQKKRREQAQKANHPSRKRIKIVFNPDQQRALRAILEQPAGTFLLHGVTGSGKTQVYIEAAKAMREAGKSSIILVPEISLTSQLVAEFANHFENLVVTHSGMTEAQRHVAWMTCLNTNQPVVVIGPRSALFSPLKSLGLIVIDECHEPTFKQDQAPRYSALRVASILAKEHGAKLILGSATPSVTDYFLATKFKTPILDMPAPAATTTQPAKITVVDQKDRSQFSRHRFLSNKLLETIQESLAQGRQALLFHNRRGTAPNCLCEQCGWLAACPDCLVPLTLHADRHQLLCHLCGFHQRVPHACPQCGYPDIIFKGIGTKLIEQEIKKLFPKARVARFDADNHATEALHVNYQALYDGGIDIIIGTQLLAKGLDLPKLKTVGVIQADSGLMMPDYTAEERVFQLIYQVTGRVGRHSHATDVILQSYQPDHPAIQAALARDYGSFYRRQIAERQRAGFPPFTYLLKLVCSYKTEAGAVEAGKKLAAKLRRTFPEVEVQGPTPSFYERLGGNYRWQILIKSNRRGALLDIIKTLPPTWAYDIDPANLL